MSKKLSEKHLKKILEAFAKNEPDGADSDMIKALAEVSDLPNATVEALYKQIVADEPIVPIL